MNEVKSNEWTYEKGEGKKEYIGELTDREKWLSEWMNENRVE